MNGLTIYTSEELKQIQHLGLEMLKEFIKICDMLNVDYFLDGGTLLGAVRHKGFIPWDDDIDVGMLREDYNRFLAEAPALLSKRYELQTPYNGKNSPYVYAKIRANGTSFIEYCNRNVRMHHGVYIDIFPYDTASADVEKAQREHARYQKLSRLFVWRQSPDVSQPPVGMKMRARALVRKLGHWLLQPIPASKIMNWLDRIATRYLDSASDNLTSFYVGKKRLSIRKSDMFPVREGIFEGLKVKIPKDYDLYLTELYGDYMTLPPEEDRYGHKPWRVEIS